ncbi:hypothetical protein [Pelagicoccus mobilis]|uniref:Uncharacterized protein n=1 Tax=Pelagicoccus mobilis TaxID=415221 RepID=A0A934RUH9_9BACT|nr:hypothetical protein [Pelagicoccus mobilis]MBK1876658.1 hypothetical protein [Pelagicoccus mobilis]
MSLYSQDFQSFRTIVFGAASFVGPSVAVELDADCEDFLSVGEKGLGEVKFSASCDRACGSGARDLEGERLVEVPSVLSGVNGETAIEFEGGEYLLDSVSGETEPLTLRSSSISNVGASSRMKGAVPVFGTLKGTSIT